MFNLFETCDSYISFIYDLLTTTINEETFLHDFLIILKRSERVEHLEGMLPRYHMHSDKNSLFYKTVNNNMDEEMM